MSDSLSPIGEVRSEELPRVLELLFQYLPEPERRERAGQILTLIARGEFSPTWIRVYRNLGELLGCVVCQPGAGATGLICPPQAPACADRSQIEDALLAEGTRWLEDGGCKQLQCMLSGREVFLAASLLRNGFSHITRLRYLQYPLSSAASFPTATRCLEFQAYPDCDPATFGAILRDTFTESLDCPELNGVRELPEILASLRAQGPFDPQLWQLVWEDSVPVGVLVMVVCSDFSGLELVYLGIVPERRGRGLGRTLVLHVLHEAKRRNLAQVILSADTRNTPALALYHSLGFCEFDAREVYMRFKRLS